MTTHAVERDRFMATMEAEGMPREISRRILRHAQTTQRCAELACSSEAADRDQVRCNAAVRLAVGCLCKDYGSFKLVPEKCEIQTIHDCEHGDHGTVPRYMVTSARAERLILEWCDTATLSARNLPARFDGTSPAFAPIFSGDPRGACVKIKVPSGKTDDWGGVGVCVPTR